MKLLRPFYNCLRLRSKIRVFDSHGRQRRAESGSPFARSVPASIALASVLISCAAAQIPSPIGDQNAVMGFETTAAWFARGDTASSMTASSTATRTQGKAAYALMKPANLTTLTSLPVGSTAKAIKGAGDAGALFEVDVLLPIEEGNPLNRGSLELSISVPSHRLNNVLIGKVNFEHLRLGIFTTMKFPIPDVVRSALGPALKPSPVGGDGFNDLTFQFKLESPRGVAGAYIFDNLRVHSVPPAITGTGAAPPPGYGGSVDLLAVGSAPAAQVFDAGPVQVPDAFHLTVGGAGTTTVKLELGFDGAPSFTCTYHPDSSDASGKSYILTSCTGGIQAGDLVGANWARLTIVGAPNLTMTVRAQLAKNPVGDLVGAGLIPPMPTFWGDSDSCVVAPVKGRVVTSSTSCANQAAQASQIVTAYFNKVNNSNNDPNWVVTPSPEFGRRTGDGSPHNNLGPPPSAKLSAEDTPFDEEGHLNQGGAFDAYWRLNGDLATHTTPDNHYTTHLDANFSGHVIVWGGDVDILALNSAIDTDSGQITATGFVSPRSTGSLHMYLFGNEIAGGGSNDISFNYQFGDRQDLNVATVHIWIFSITLGATASVGVNATGGLSPESFDVSLTPHASMGAHIEGGVDIVIASGQVDARIDLLTVSTPLSAHASWNLDTRPSSCSSTLNLSLDGQAQISWGGGEVDLVATFGICPFCFHESWRLFDWAPVYSHVQPLFHEQVANQSFPLPPKLCIVPLNVSINSPVSTVSSNINTQLLGAAYSPNNNSAVPCTDFKWAVDGKPIGQGCNVTYSFPPSPTARTLTLSAIHPVPNQFGTIWETGSASETITVKPTPVGSYIDQTIPAAVEVVDGCGFNCPSGPAIPPLNGKHLSIVLNNVPQVVQLVGQVIPSSGNTTTTWTAKDSNGTTTMLGTGLSINWMVNKFDTYTVTMTTKDSGGNVVGTAIMYLRLPAPPR